VSDLIKTSLTQTYGCVLLTHLITVKMFSTGEAPHMLEGFYKVDRQKNFPNLPLRPDLAATIQH